jgi:hypothetical protein
MLNIPRNCKEKMLFKEDVLFDNFLEAPPKSKDTVEFQDFEDKFNQRSESFQEFLTDFENMNLNDKLGSLWEESSEVFRLSWFWFEDSTPWAFEIDIDDSVATHYMFDGI